MNWTTISNPAYWSINNAGSPFHGLLFGSTPAFGSPFVSASGAHTNAGHSRTNATYTLTLTASPTVLAIPPDAVRVTYRLTSAGAIEYGQVAFQMPGGYIGLAGNDYGGGDFFSPTSGVDHVSTINIPADLSVLGPGNVYLEMEFEGQVTGNTPITVSVISIELGYAAPPPPEPEFFQQLRGTTEVDS